MATLNSEIILVKNIRLDKDYINVLSYSESQMLNLCRQNAVATDYDYSFIRQNNNSIYANFSYEQCLQANYIAFQNKDYSNKWFFAFIDEVIYTGEQNTEIRYTIDAWSTWFDYWQKQPCFISRQHVNSDTIGEHTIAENLDVGEIIQEMETEDISLSQYTYVAVLSSWNPATKKQFSAITVYNKQVFGKQLFFVDASDLSNLVNLGLFILDTNADGHAEDIDSIFFVPSAVISPSQLKQYTANVGGQEYSFYGINNTFEIETFDTVINKLTKFSDYTPKNNKCFCYPYNYLFVTNNIGNDNIYKYEDFYSDNCVFRNELAISIGCSGHIVPLNYKKISKNYDEALPLAKYPTCSWSTDAYTNWLTQQAVNIPTQIVGSVVNAGSNIATGNIVGGATSIANDILGQIGSFYSASLLPNITKGQNTADIVFSANKNTFTFRQLRAKTEYMRIIDDYFTRFGYKLNSLTLPNIVGRRNWNYLEIGQSESVGYGSVPSSYMEEINNACRKGTTIWHNHENIGNYSLDNSIV